MKAYYAVLLALVLGVGCGEEATPGAVEDTAPQVVRPIENPNLQLPDVSKGIPHPDNARGNEETKIPLSSAVKIVIIRSVKPPVTPEKEGVETHGLTNSDAGRIMTTVPGVKRVLPILSQRKNVVHGRREVDCQLIGTYPYYPDFTQSRIVAGQFLNEAEENSKAASCVISTELAERLFAGHNPLMEKVIVRGFESSQVFQVKGILQERVDTEKLPQEADALGRTISANVYIPLSAFKSLYGIKNIDRSVGSLSVERVELTEIRVEFGSVEEVIPALPLLRKCLNKSRKGKADYEIHTPLLQK